MKLKQVLTEGPITYRGRGGERNFSWEEPEDDDYSDPVMDVQTVVVKMYTPGNEAYDVKVEYQLDTTNNELVDVEAQSIILPSGKEVDIETASNVIGADEVQEMLAKEHLADAVVDHLGGQVEISRDLYAAPASQGETMAATAAPVAAPKVPTAA